MKPVARFMGEVRDVCFAAFCAGLVGWQREEDVGAFRSVARRDRPAVCVRYCLDNREARPVSVNGSGQVAIRASLADGVQVILRADPAG
jgi:hypothetical protein